MFEVNRKKLVCLMIVSLMLAGCLQSHPDLDGDGIADLDDSDLDGDGWENLVEEECESDPLDSENVSDDLDEDRICDILDDDIDGDGWKNNSEIECNKNTMSNESFPKDTDGDGMCDYIDTDADGDGWMNNYEIECKVDHLNNSSFPDDIDEDGICDNIDLDTDGDGLFNNWEIERGLNPLDSKDYLICHGETYFCQRTYDNFTFPATHNSFATVGDGVMVGVNHYLGLDDQWNNGIRAFLLDVYHKSYEETDPDDIRFCHGTTSFFHPCQFGEVNAYEWLNNLTSLLNNSSGEIVTIFLENYISGEHLEILFNDTGILERSYSKNLNEEWPDIGDMIINGKDIVIFYQFQYENNFSWMNHAWTHSWDTPWDMRDIDDLTCELGRGDGTQQVWSMNNWIFSKYGLADSENSRIVNDYDFLLDRAISCWEKVGKRPTFIAVDYWEEGNLTNVTKTLNYMADWNL